MLKNYVLVSFRNILRHKSYSIINIFGLAAGLTCFLMIMLWVRYEINYDTFHEKSDRIYMLCINGVIGGTTKILPIANGAAAPAMVQDFPEVVNAVRFEDSSKKLVKYRDKQLYVDNVFYAGNEVFDIFSYPLAAGDAGSALATAKSVVITETTARKIFGEEDPVGQVIKIDNESGYKVTGVLKDIPRQSHLKIDMLISYEEILAAVQDRRQEWLNFNRLIYLLLDENADPKVLESKFPAFIDRYIGREMDAAGITLNYFLKPIKDIHLYSNFDFEIPGSGNITHVYIFSGIALFILLIACFNFVNLSTARSAARAKEVGIRKTCGAVRLKLIGQFIGESVIYCLIALVLAIILIELILPYFNAFTGQEIKAEYFKSPVVLFAFIGITLLVGLAAGFYPALYMSSFRPIKVLKSNFNPGGSILQLRRILVIAQFTVSIILIISTICIYYQLGYMKNSRLGFQGEQVLVIPDVNEKAPQYIDILLKEFKSTKGVLNASVSSFVPGEFSSKSAFVPEGFTPEQSQLMDQIQVDNNYLSTLGIELVQGRDFSPELSSDSSESVIINQAAARIFGWDEPVGKTIKTMDMEDDTLIWNSRTVIGVVRDFHTTSLHSKIEPMYIGYKGGEIDMLCLRLDTDNIPQTVENLDDTWSEITSGLPFDYYFLDDSFNALYQKEEKLGKLTMYFCLLAILLGCLGLYGLSAYAAEKRTKEIGIRKVLGASLTGIIALLSKEFLLLVGISNIVAWPVAYFALNKWLENYAYRISLPVYVFIFTAFISLSIALATILFQAFRAARVNPVETLRYE